MLFIILGIVAPLGWCLCYLFAIPSKTTADHIFFGTNLTLGLINLVILLNSLLN